ncbi:MAG: hypothetical protein ACSHXI_04670 [Hoeflea sp.]
MPLEGGTDINSQSIMDDRTLHTESQAFDVTHTHRKFQPAVSSQLTLQKSCLFRAPDAFFGDEPANRYRQTGHLLFSQERTA